MTVAMTWDELAARPRPGAGGAIRPQALRPKCCRSGAPSCSCAATRSRPGGARLRARHILASVHGTGQLPGQPPRGDQARPGRQPRQLRSHAGDHPHPPADPRATGCSWPKAMPGSISAAPWRRPSLRAASTLPPATWRRSPRRPWPTWPAAAPVPVDLLRVVQRLALEVAGRSFFSQGMRSTGRRCAAPSSATAAGWRGHPSSISCCQPRRPARWTAARWWLARDFKRVLDQMIAERGRTPPADPPRDLFDVLVAARDPRPGPASRPTSCATRSRPWPSPATRPRR